MKVRIVLKKLDQAAAQRVKEFFVNKLKLEGLDGNIEEAKILRENKTKKTK